MEKDFAAEVIGVFDTRVITLLYYGSRAFSKASVSNLSDYDFTLVLDWRKHGDLEELAKITAAHDGIDLTVHYLVDLEAMGWDNFQEGSHGSYFLNYLATSKVLIGRNIFLDQLTLLDAGALERSMRRKIVEYFWRLDSWHFQTCRDEHLMRRYKKYLVRIAQDILLVKQEMSYADINAFSDDEFIEQFICKTPHISEKTKNAMMRVRGSVEPSNFANLVKARESLHDDFRTIFNTIGTQNVAIV